MFGKPILHNRRIAEPVKGNPVLALIHGSGGEQAGALRHVLRDDHGRAELETLRQAIGFIADHSRGDKLNRADTECVAHFDPQAVDRALRKPSPVSARRSDDHAVCQRQFAIQRPLRIYRLEFHWCRCITGAGHRLHPCAAGNCAKFGQCRAFISVQVALPDLDFEIAAKQFLPTRREFPLDCRTESADGGQCSRTQENAYK